MATGRDIKAKDWLNTKEKCADSKELIIPASVSSGYSKMPNIAPTLFSETVLTSKASDPKNILDLTNAE
jgi:hypothetical protein